MKSPNYNVVERALHELALGFPTIAEMSFDIEKTIITPSRRTVNEQHIFISGLARAGTTMMMQVFHETGAFRSLTYRDMPFVLMPNLWKKLMSPFSKKGQLQERAHGDGILIDHDSPEAFEDVFWRILSSEYIRKDRLITHHPSYEILQEFRTYVDLILSDINTEVERRYLSKNNNNILRISSIRKAFPNALILIPFRNPLGHAYSLMQQHKRFYTNSNGNNFTSRYMRFLCHHEFGEEHRPFVFADDEFERISKFSTESIEYWLEIWKNTYQFLLSEGKRSGCFFLSYEQLCSNPKYTFGKLFEHANIDFCLNDLNFNLVPRDQPLVDCKADNLTEAVQIHEKLLHTSE